MKFNLVRQTDSPAHKMEVVLLDKLQKALQFEGLTPFSSSIAIEYLKVNLIIISIFYY